MRQMISGLVAAIAVMTAGVAPASACGYGGCCGAYVSPCLGGYVPAYGYAGCWTCGWAFERLAEPTTQYYYVNQGPTYSGPGAFAPYPTYEESALPVWGAYRYRHRYVRYPYSYHQWAQPVPGRYY
jgi:hypothetical protein